MKVSENFVPAGKVLRAVSCNVHCAADDVRLKLAFPREDVGAFYETAFPCDEIVLLATCNRIEIYSVVSAGTENFEAAALAARAGVPVEKIEENLQFFEGLDAIAHLTAVATGLESKMVGEIEIFGQVKDAYDMAVSKNKTRRVLNKVFQKVFHFAKYLRSNTAIAQGQVSIGNVAVSLAQRIFGDLSRSTVFVAGTGDAGKKVARAFANRSAGTIVIASRHFENACALAEEIGAGTSVTPLKNFKEHLRSADIVIGALSVPEPLIDAGELGTLLRSRDGRPLFFIDLGQPPNFAADLATLSEVWLYTLDDLAGIANKNLQARLADMDACRQEITARVNRSFGNSPER
ncbi:MAG: glutamyl-tRNA reductase [Opitutales bacterium]|nr:glutamyl-tRNA reductase [Opitutales bacterium]